MNGQVEPYLYVHCEVELCNLTDSKPSCMKDCNNKVDTRLRREVNTDIYDLERGPIVILRSYGDSMEDEPDREEESGNNQGTGYLLDNQTVPKSRDKIWWFII